MLDAARAAQRRTDSFTRKQELKQAEDALDQAAIAENLSQLDLKRVRQLVSQGAEAPQALDRATAAYDSAVARRRADLRLTGRSDCIIAHHTQTWA